MHRTLICVLFAVGCASELGSGGPEVEREQPETLQEQAQGDADDAQAGASGDAQPSSVLCPAIAYQTNGRCEPPPGCERLDAEDCKNVACTFILHPTDGVCQAAPGCVEQDPVDCGPGGRVCTKIRHPDNGVCEAAPGCIEQDPVDCKSGEGTVCALIRYPTNGVCEAPAGCDHTDPADCTRGDPPEGKVCGGFAGVACEANEFCNFARGNLVCGRFDGTGICEPKPEVCTNEYAPVCGCDGKTYSNRCAVHAAGVTLEHDGPC